MEENKLLLKLIIPILNRSLDDLEIIYSILEENKLLDTLEAIDWLDELNKISVRH